MICLVFPIYEGAVVVMSAYCPKIVSGNVWHFLAIYSIWFPLRSCLTFTTKVAAKLSHLPKHEVSLNLGLAKLMCYSFHAIPMPLVTLWWSSDSLHLETSILISNTPSPMPLRAQIFNRPEIYFKKWRIHTLYFQITQILSEVSLVLLFSWVWERKNIIFQENSSTWTVCFYLITSDSK